VTIEFKEFGIRLNFEPKVTADGQVRMLVEPEVSVLDFGPSAVKLGGFEIPGLVIRRASTTVQMRPGESLVVGGLLSQMDTETDRRIPWIGNIPILGQLFRSERFKKEETELLVLVTPRLKTPTVLADQPESFGDQEMVERALSRQIAPPPYPDPRAEAIRRAVKGLGY
jgi:pilus assembly protein CpaC